MERENEMKKRYIGMMLMALCMIGVSSATSILWCSGGAGDPDFDQGWLDLLVERGYTVDRLEDAETMTQAKVDLANTYDLVIVGRDTISDRYDDTGEIDLWNSITSPMIGQTGYLWRNNRWKWLNSGSTLSTTTNMAVDLAADDPLYVILFNGVTLDENGTFNYTANSVTLAETRSAGNGILIGHRNYDPQPWVYAAYWPQGVEFYSDAGAYANGPRLALAGGYTGDSFRGGFNLTDAGTRVFLNAVYFMSGATFDRKPFVSAGNDRIANLNEAITLDASVFDPDSAPAITWTQLSGPGIAAFDDSSIEGPGVTFDAKGTYELEISVTDGTSTITDQMTVTVRDNADNALIAHWDFETLPDPNTLFDVTGNGFTGLYYNESGRDPNVTAGNLFGGSQAADMTTNIGYWEVANSYDNTDPNFSDLATGMTAAAWVNSSDSSVNAPVIVGNGLDGWRLGVNVGAYNLVCHEIGLDLFTSGLDPYDGLWHHVVGVYDAVASQAYIYVDGYLAASAPVTPGSFFSKGEDYPLIQIANRGDAERPWKGFIDDIRVFNYPLNAAEIEALASEGNRAVSVSAGEDQSLVFKGTAIQLAGQLLADDGVPAPATLEWSVVSVPMEIDPASVTFSDTAAADAQVMFPNVEGAYILRLTADDGEYIDFDDVNITIDIPTCADVIADGYGFTADLSGPEGTPDCRVDMYDFAAMAADWLRCNDPDDPGCEWAYQQ